MIKYSKSHEWINVEGNKAKIGLTDYAQKELGDLVYVNLPEVGSEVKCGEAFTDVESVKAVSEVLSPCCGTVVAVNDELENAPEKINEDAMNAWIVEVEVKGLADDLMTEEEYAAFIK